MSWGMRRRPRLDGGPGCGYETWAFGAGATRQGLIEHVDEDQAEAEAIAWCQREEAALYAEGLARAEVSRETTQWGDWPAPASALWEHIRELDALTSEERTR